ncbi:MAG: flagellar motor switch phosphatase FliY [Oscillospiraceae bacterium]|jgi:flagellar motor switch protein FliN/FliY|nr:flagellar motor switch phosphatase FliY [Oscillospiraceae bacterium]
MNLSQEEIEAMLSGQSVALDQADANETDKEARQQEDLLTELADDEDVSPEEILSEVMKEEAPPEDIDRSKYFLTGEESDLLGEVGNICMGAVATTMYTLLDRPVSITTPRVSVHTTQNVLAMYTMPFVVVAVEYTKGIEGKNLLLLKEDDAALITDILMGGDGNVELPVELNELHMSAISEIMNQMIGASATALSKLLGVGIDISPPVSNRVDARANVSSFLDEQEIVIKVSFDMEIEGLLKSQLLQLMPFQLGRDLAKKMLSPDEDASDYQQEAAPAMPEAQPTQQPSLTSGRPPMSAPVQQPQYQPPYAQPQYPYPVQPQAPQPGSLVDVHSVQYQSFDAMPSPPPFGGSLGLVHDIPLQVSVELGKTKREVSEILDMAVGSVVVLDKIAGDPVEVFANGKLIARGEVVVIEENYGVRITEIVSK